MATVFFSSQQRTLTDGAERVEIPAARVSELIQSLYARFPRLAGSLDRAAVAIDGDVHNDPRYLRLAPDSEVHFLGPIQGGR